MQVKKKRGTDSSMCGEVLVAIMNDKGDLAILQEQKWYRIPVDSAPKPWRIPQWLAFYQTKKFGEDAFAVNYYGRVSEVEIVKRRELFPNEIASTKSEREYYRIQLESVKRLTNPVRSARLRRIVFIPTTWQKFQNAGEINDLFHESPLEERLWAEFKNLKIPAERQWDLRTGTGCYFLDFALFCEEGQIDVETDGDTWHAIPKHIPEDNKRDNTVTSVGWHVLRFNGKQIRESLVEYCVPRIADTIRTLGGLSGEGLVPRKFFKLPEGMGQQLTLFGPSVEHDEEEEWD